MKVTTVINDGYLDINSDVERVTSSITNNEMTGH